MSNFRRSGRGKSEILPRALLSAIAGFGVGRLASVPIRRATDRAFQGILDVNGERQPTLSDVERYFNDGTAKWNNYIKAHDGYLPSDPYRFLLESGIVDVASQLQSFEFADPTPVRINVELARNPKLPIFWWNPWIAPGEVWVCYADGTWDRRDEPPNKSCWRRPMEQGAYPLSSWTSWRQRAEWTAANKDQLVWDEPRRTYGFREKGP